MAILRYFLIFQLFCVKLSTLNSRPQHFKNQITQLIDFQTEFVENGFWLQNFMEFVKVKKIIKEFKIGAKWR